MHIYYEMCLYEILISKKARIRAVFVECSHSYKKEELSISINPSILSYIKGDIFHWLPLAKRV